MDACRIAAETTLAEERLSNSKVVISSVPYVYINGKLYTEAEAKAMQGQGWKL